MTTALSFVESPPGLAPLCDFTLDEVEGAPGLHTMRSSGEPGIRLFVLDAPVYLPWYEPAFDDENYASIGGRPDTTRVLVVATISEGAPVVNLMAPVLVNRATGAARQVILGEEWPLAARLSQPGAA
ncbi:flagellar assembly protein FliW [Lysinimonas soli]|uniref:Flagellar assembly protein FliW n=1 Tax=Lysinimonas soli TaxID=1074233 RepID=A0ABW0NSQ3_9MICO